MLMIIEEEDDRFVPALQLFASPTSVNLLIDGQ